MKIKINKQPQGNVLLATMLVTLIVGVALSSYLTLVSVQNQSTLRSQAWNNSIPIMEAGIEEALTALQYYRSANMDKSGWTFNAADGFYHTSGTLRNGSTQNAPNAYSYDVGIKLPPLGQPDQPIIECFGYSPSPNNLATSPDKRLSSPYGMILGAVGLAPLFKPDVSTTKRKVRVITRSDPLFSKAMAAQGLIDMNGRWILTDSFDSTDSKYSTLGQYDSSKNKAGGDVATNGQLVNVNNAVILGHVATGPGGTVQIKQWASVGDKSWVPTIGIEPGYATDDMNVDFGGVSVPAAAVNTTKTAYSSTSGGANLLTGGVLGTTNYFKLNNLSGKITVTDNVVVYVPAGGTVNFSGSKDGITLANGATLTMYVGATSVTISGNGIVNPGSALNFQYYGLPSNTSISISGNGNFTGAIDAPSAALTLNGFGSNGGFIGSCIVNSVTMNGDIKFHYDEALAKLGPIRGYIVTSWNEVNPNN